MQQRMELSKLTKLKRTVTCLSVLLYLAAASLTIPHPAYAQISEFKITASDGAAADEFGRSVSISGDYAVVGAYLDDDNGTNAGSAYVFKRTGTSWAQEAKLLATDGAGAAGDRFGNSVSISGDYAVVGAYLDDDNGTDAGSAYVFKRTGTSWAQEAKLLASDGGVGDRFGNSVSISGDYAVVGAAGDRDNGTYSGSVYVFKRSGTSWTQEAKLLPSDGAANDEFGTSVSISGNYAVVGAWFDDDKGTDAGSAYVFKRPATNSSWAQEAKLLPSDGAAGDRFGASVSISGDYAIVGAYFDADNGTNSGSAYLFKRSVTSWTQEAKILPSDGAAFDEFGRSVSISGDYAVVGARFEDNTGSAYMFKRTGTSWQQEAKLLPSDGAAGDEFGVSVSISGDFAVVGAHRDDVNGTNAGSAYLYNGFIPPAAPSGLAATASAGQIALKWNKNTESDLAKYRIYRDTASPATTLIDSVTSPSPPDTFYTDTGLVGGTTYYYRVTAVNNAGNESGFSNEVSATPFAPLPADISLSPDPLNFGDVNSGDTLSMQLSITNGGNVALDVVNITVSNTEFSVASPTNFQVAAGTTVNKAVSFNPSSVGAKSATLTVTSNASNLPTATVTLGGIGITRPVYMQISEFKITASDGAADDWFGWSVSISGDYAVVGANADDDKGTNSGSAYIFKRTGTSWAQEAKLLSSDGAANDFFGESVSISGDYAVVGAWADDDNGDNSGSAYIFKRSGTSWAQEVKLLPSDGAFNDQFGSSVSISGDYAVVGARADDDEGTNSGSAYVFKRSGTSWAQEAKLLPFDGASNDLFGNSVSISGDYAVVGAKFDDDNGSLSGSAYVFKRTGTSWAQEAKLLASDGAVEDQFGFSVSISGDYAVVGAQWDDDNGSSSGSAYVFKRTGTSWAQEAKLIPSDGAAGDFFGESVSISGDYAVVGAHLDSDNGGFSGSAYLFKRNGTTWQQEAKILASDGAAADRFGFSVSISGDYVVMGAYEDNDNGGSSGSAYIYSGSTLNLPSIVSHYPAQNALAVPKDTIISITFAVDMDPASFDSTTFVIHASQTGLHRGTYPYNSGGKTVTLDPRDDFAVGEEVSVTLTTGIKNAGGDTLLNPYTWTFTVEVEDGSGLFAEQVTYGAGTAPLDVASADLDGDGDQDMAVSNSGSNTVSILLNNGDGTFVSQVTYGVGSFPVDIIAADLDGDGDQDLAVSNSGSNTISILINNGDGTFASQVTYGVGINPESITSSDLDGDGDQDLAVSHSISNNVSVLLNNGDGTFASQVTYGVGTSPRNITSADLDADGDQDLAVSNLASNTVSVLLNNGDGTFASQVTYGVGSVPVGITSADFDGDGDQDMAVSNSGSNTISILLNNGDGTFASQVTYGVGSSSQLITSADLDGDGDQDLAVPNQNSNTVSVLLNNGDGTFASHVTYGVDSGSRGIISADFDGDGDQDLAVTNQNPNTVSVLFNRNSTPDITLFPDPLNFGGVNSGDTLGMQLTITNSGNAALDVTNITVSNSEFSVASPTSFQVAAGTTLNKTVSFLPTSTGLKSATLTVTSNASNLPSATVNLSGIGITRPVYSQISEFKIIASDGATNDAFGRSVSISGDYAVVAALWDDDSGTDAGSAYVFKRSGKNWTQEAKLSSSDGAAGDWFGESVSISGDYAVVGALQDDDNGTSSGSAYVFKRTGTSWEQEAKLLSADGAPADQFGASVSISGDYTVVGARLDDDNGNRSGSAYVFKRTGTSWVQEAKLLATDGAADDYFGWSVSISGDYTIIGAYQDDDDGSSSGSAYIFSGRPDAPFISIASDTLDFGKVDKKVPFDLDLKILNRGKISLVVDDINSSSPAFSVIDTAFSIEADTFRTLPVTFTPDTVGLFDDSLTVFSNDPLNPAITVSLKAEVQSMVTLNADLTAEQSGDITFNYSIQTIEGDTITLMPEYSIDSGENWSIAKITGNINDLTPQLYSGSFVWHSRDDLPGLDLKTVRFRTMPVTSNSDTGFTTETPDFHLDNNELPEIVFISTPAGEQTGDISLSYVPMDAENDILSYIYEYSDDSGVNWLRATVPGAVQSGAAAVNTQPSKLSSRLKYESRGVGEKSHPIMKGVSTSAGKTRDFIANTPSVDTLFVVWSSGEDILNKDLTTVRFRVTPVDNDTGVTLATGDFWVDNLTGPLVLNHFPSDSGLWSEPLLVYFDRTLDIASLEGKLNVNSAKIGIMTGAISFDDVQRLLRFKTDGSFAGLDTVEVFLSAGILDSLGNGLDGDGDGDPEGSPEDDYKWTFVTPRLADYDFSGSIGFNDLAIFADAWNSDPQDIGKEIGPATGSVPDLIVQPDNVLDFEDLVVFLQMWTWSEKNALGKTTEELFAQESLPDDKFLYLTEPSFRGDGVTLLKLKSREGVELQASRIWIEYDPEEFGNFSIMKSPVLSADGEQVIFLDDYDSKSGRAEINMARLRNRQAKELSVVDELLVISFKTRDVRNGIVSISYDLRGSSNVSLASGVNEQEIRDLILPREFSLSQNYPNPFNPITTINYSIPTQSRVKLQIYNLLGQVVTTLVDADKNPGYYEAIWNGTNQSGKSVSSGLYFYSLRAGQFSDTKKMVILK